MARSRNPNRGKGGPRRSRAPRAGRLPAPRAPGSFTLADVAAAVGGRVRGKATLMLRGVATLEAAGPADLSWVADERRAAEAARSAAGALLVFREELAAGKPCVLVERPQLALAGWLDFFRPRRLRKSGVARGAFVHRTATLGPGV